MTGEKRESRRFSPPNGKEEGVLRIKGRDYTVFVEDLSSGGFGVTTDYTCTVLSDEEALLKTGSGWHRVRIVHIQPKQSFQYVGLELLEDVTEDEVRISSLSWFGRISPWHRSGGRSISPGKAFVGLVLLGLICGLLYLSSTLGGKVSEVISNPF